jgi:hypothetical protein
MTERLTWSGDWSKNVGTVNGVHLFTILRNNGHNPDGFPFTITHRFGAFSQLRKCYAAEPYAKEVCETVLLNIMTKLGFVPAPDPATPEETETP